MQSRNESRLGLVPFAAALLVSSFFSVPVLSAQAFDSGSDGSDGALTIPAGGGTLIFDPSTFVPPLDADGDGIYHFTTIDIASDTTVEFRSQELGSRPVIWLATGNVQIDGILELKGQNGSITGGVARAGAGGFDGGAGMTIARGAQPGGGPGGGQVHPADAGGAYPGAGAGHSVAGDDATCSNQCAPGGATYGNGFLQPLLGGSGGAGGGLPAPDGILGGDGGGAGGGAILIASSLRIGLGGAIDVRGGNGAGSGGRPGGGGSGGAVRLVAPLVEGSGVLDLRGGARAVVSSFAIGGAGSPGRARIEAYDDRFAGSIFPQEVRRSVPGNVLPSANTPIVRIASIAGVNAPAAPGGGYQPVDMTVNAAGPTTLALEGAFVPLGTEVVLTLSSEDGDTMSVLSTPLAGTFEASTATATMTLPSGFSKFTVQATWTP